MSIHPIDATFAEELVGKVQRSKLDDDFITNEICENVELPDFWRGYFTAYIGGLLESLSWDDADFKWYLLKEMGEAWLEG